jgi:hypothetical protein
MMRVRVGAKISAYFLSLCILLIAFLLAGCRAVLTETPVTPTWTTEPAPPSPSIPVVPTSNEVVINENVFFSQYCPLSLIPKFGWMIQEHGPGEPGSYSMDVSLIELIKDQYRLAIVCQIGSDETTIGPGGLPAGENVSLLEITILDKLIPGQAIVSEGVTLSAIYVYQSEFIKIISHLGSNPYPSNTVPDDEFDITQETIKEVAGILATLTLTEDLESTVVADDCCEPPVILPMDENYHSQIDDSDLPNACAPTAGFIVLDYLKRETSIDNVIDLLRSIEPEQGGYDPNCERNVVCTSPMALAQQLSQEYRITIHTRQHWTLETAHNALSNGHPIIADILYRLNMKGLGHFVVIFGVDLENELIYYHDPLDGESLVSGWQEFSARWAGPVDVGDPTYPQGFHYWGMEVYSEKWELIPPP